MCSPKKSKRFPAADKIFDIKLPSIPGIAAKTVFAKESNQFPILYRTLLRKLSFFGFGAGVGVGAGEGLAFEGMNDLTILTIVEMI